MEPIEATQIYTAFLPNHSQTMLQAWISAIHRRAVATGGTETIQDEYYTADVKIRYVQK